MSKLARGFKLDKIDLIYILNSCLAFAGICMVVVLSRLLSFGCGTYLGGALFVFDNL